MNEWCEMERGNEGYWLATRLPQVENKRFNLKNKQEMSDESEKSLNTAERYNTTEITGIIKPTHKAKR